MKAFLLSFQKGFRLFPRFPKKKHVIKQIGAPETIYSDQESGFRNSPEWLAALKEHDITHIYSRSGHAPFAESAIAHLRNDITRIRRAKQEAGLKIGKQQDTIEEYFKNHNANQKNYITKLTPDETDQNILLARAREEAYRLIHYKETTPVELKLGDKVVVAKKIGRTEKRSTAERFDDTPKEITKVDNIQGVGNLFTVGGKEYLKRDLQPVKNIIKLTETPSKSPVEQTNSNKIALSQVAVPGAKFNAKEC